MREFAERVILTKPNLSMKNYFISLILLLSSTGLWGQQNHLLVLSKKDVGGQIYTTAKEFPSAWVKKHWDQSYNIHSVNFKKGEWFVVMNKQGGKKQAYYFNPSGDIIKEKLQDGYKIQDNCPYSKANKRGTFYVFTKVSNNPQRQYYYSGEAGLIGYKPWKTLPDQIKAGWDKDYRVDNARSMLMSNGKTYISLFMPKMQGNPPQIMRSRTEFPSDLIQNKRSQGYFLSSICWDHYNEKWLVIMTKYNNTPPWTWMNYKTSKDKINDYINNKGYSISGVY